MKTASYLRDFNMAAFWAGITGFVWYAFGTVPLHIAVSGQLGLTAAQSSQLDADHLVQRRSRFDWLEPAAASRSR
jgi:hypothetical protein